MEGQNDGSVGPLLISATEFEGWVARQRAALAAAGGAAAAVPLVAESNAEMRGSYAMLDAGCRCGPLGGGCSPGGAGPRRGRAPAAPARSRLPAASFDRAPPGPPPVHPAPRAAPARFFTNASGGHEYGPGIFQRSPAGDVAAAWAGVAAAGFSAAKFGARGGVYEWGQGREHLERQLEQWGGARLDGGGS